MKRSKQPLQIGLIPKCFSERAIFDLNSNALRTNVLFLDDFVVPVENRLGKEGDSSASVLAVAEGVRPQSMAAILGALDAAGLIERRPDPEDGRRQLITLSAAGRERAAGDRQARAEWLARRLHEDFTEPERQTLIAAAALLERLVQR